MSSLLDKPGQMVSSVLEKSRAMASSIDSPPGGLTLLWGVGTRDGLNDYTKGPDKALFCFTCEGSPADDSTLSGGAVFALKEAKEAARLLHAVMIFYMPSVRDGDQSRWLATSLRAYCEIRSNQNAAEFGSRSPTQVKEMTEEQYTDILKGPPFPKWALGASDYDSLRDGLGYYADLQDIMLASGFANIRGITGPKDFAALLTSRRWKKEEKLVAGSMMPPFMSDFSVVQSHLRHFHASPTADGTSETA